MPPIHATAALRVYRNSADDPEEARAWLRDLYPRLFRLHGYLYREQDPNDTGLVAIWHPWESGQDNSPMWDEPLRGLHDAIEEIPVYQRRDLDKGVDPAQRPSDEHYDCFAQLVELFCRLQYDGRRAADHFQPGNYWRGPVWINTNWLLMHGLFRHGFDGKARAVRDDIIELVRRWGFHEFFDPFEGHGLGSPDFSWTAALFLDVTPERDDG